MGKNVELPDRITVADIHKKMATYVMQPLDIFPKFVVYLLSQHLLVLQLLNGPAVH